MNIVILTPLFPPDIGKTALYTKEVSRRLAEHHNVTIITYGHLPEQVSGVSIITINKRTMLPTRLLKYTYALIKNLRETDVIYIQNGPSIELPLSLTLPFYSIPLVGNFSDSAAHHRTKKSFLHRTIERMAFHKATTIENIPPEKPEILPFEEFPKEAYESYEYSWQQHMQTLEKIFTHAKNN